MTKEEIFNSHMNKAGINFRSSLQTYEKILDAMQEYAELYHQYKLKNNGDLGNVVGRSKQLCPNCKSLNIEIDYGLGELYCHDCEKIVGA